MKNVRQISKQQTLDKILESTKLLIVQKGVISMSTLDVAKNAGVAHGTVFAHFSNKELLVTAIFKRELIRIAKNLKGITYNEKIDLKDFIYAYLDYLSEEEDFITVIAKEFPFYNETIQREIIGNEAIVKIMIYHMIEKGIKTGSFKNIDITMAISYLFGTINYYLARKEYHIQGSGSLLQEKKLQITDTFLLIVKK